MRMLLAVVVGLSVGSLAACVARAPTDTGGRFKRELADDWQYWMDQYPELATQFGEPGRNGRWTDYSPEAIAAREAYLRASADRLASEDRASLSPADRLDYDLYRDSIDSAVQGLAFHDDAVPIKGVIPHNLFMPMNQLEGLAQDVPLAISLMPFGTTRDYDDLVSRLAALPALVDQTVALMEQGMAAGMTPPRVTFRDVPNQIRAQIVDDPRQSPLLASLNAFPASMSDADRQRITAAAVGAYETVARPAFQKLHVFLTTRYLPACRETPGVDGLPDGAAMYAYNVRWHTTTALTPAQIHQIGLDEVTRIRADMDVVIGQTGFKGSFAEFATFLRTDPRFYFTDAASLLAAYRDVAKRIDPQLAHLFGRLPETPYGVVPVPDAIAPSQTTAYYQPGAFAAGRPGNMYANTYKLESRPRWEMEALTMHEAVPGHHLQISLAQERPDVAAFRRNASYTAFVEGWALYSESLGGEMGFYTDPYAKFGQLTYDMWRAVRLVVDTGLHSMGWTRQEAIDYFAANTPKTIQDITVEVDRYMVWPGQALGYKIGQLKIRELRTRAEQKLGASFDVRAFHDLVLAEGAIPLDVLERRVDDWIAGVQR
ncbi:MAG: DUF885 domain-containing protein [Vicinamibacterales bacterium]